MKQSAGILAYRIKERLEVFLVHPGGPFFKNKDAGVWTIPKGELDDNEEPLIAAQREFKEETGIDLKGEFIFLQPIKQKAGKLVHAWAIECDIDHTNISSNTFEMEWPPRSGKRAIFPEVDKAAWFSIEDAKQKMNAAQFELIVQLQRIIEKN